jgi:hypothetical protein
VRDISGVGEALHGTIQSEVRGVTIAAEVTENDMSQRGLKFRQDSSGGDVREMPVAGEDALLDRPWSPGIPLQQPLVVIHFDQDRLDSAKRIEDQSGGIAEVGEHSKARTIRGNSKPDGVHGVMRDGKCPDLEAAKGKWRAGLKKVPVGVHQAGILQDACGEHIAEDGQWMARQHDFQGAGMVAMFVREEDA